MKVLWYKLKAAPSPGSLNGCRVAIKSDTDLFLASENKIIFLDLVPSIDQNVPLQAFSKESISPTPARFNETHLVPKTPNHSHEIQSIVYHTTSDSQQLIGSVDSKGHTIISTFKDNQISQSYSVRSTLKTHEHGWSGLTFHPNNPSVISLAHYFDKTIQLFQNDQSILQFSTVQNPTSIQWYQFTFSQEPILAILENNQISLWDVRISPSSSKNCFQRITAGYSSLYSMDALPHQNVIGVAGVDRTATILDCKKWVPRWHWKNCLKYEITSFLFSRSNNKLCYVSGLDSEVVCSSWGDKAIGRNEGNKKNTGEKKKDYGGFRGDSRWLGMQIQKSEDNNDLIAGYAESGSIYLIHNSQMLEQ